MWNSDISKGTIKNNHIYKAIYLDVDGTLLNAQYDGEISYKVRETIKKANSHIAVGIASGRPLERVITIFDELHLTNPCIISGGAQIVAPITKEILWEQPILPEDLAEIRDVLDNTGKKVWVVDDLTELLYAPDMKLKNPINFFFTKIDEQLADEIIAKLSKSTLALTKEVAYHPGHVSLKITHAQATKQHALEKIAELLHLQDEDIIGVGDGYNDSSLFKVCGLKVAVGNAVKELKEVADYIAPSVSEDGVAHVFEKFILRENNHLVA